jgi:hypothetical protein
VQAQDEGCYNDLMDGLMNCAENTSCFDTPLRDYRACTNQVKIDSDTYCTPYPGTACNNSAQQLFTNSTMSTLNAVGITASCYPGLDVYGSCGLRMIGSTNSSIETICSDLTTVLKQKISATALNNLDLAGAVSTTSYGVN